MDNEQTNTINPTEVKTENPVEVKAENPADAFDKKHKDDKDFHARHLTVDEIEYLRRNVLV